MPNPNPVKRTRTSSPELPAGMSPTSTPGLIRYRYTVDGQRVTKYGHTPEACFEARYAPPRPAPAPGSPTLASYLRVWVAGLALRASTIANHRTIIDTRLIPLFGETVTLAELDKPTIKARFAELRTWTVRGGNTISPQSVQLTYSTLRSALFDAVDSTPPLLVANPAARINPHGTTGRSAQGRRVGVELAIPSELDVRRLIRATAGHPWGAMVPLAAMTGLRQGEALALTDTGIDLANHWVHVTGSVSRATRAIDATKNRGSGRFVPFHPALGPILEAQIAERDRLALIGGPGYRNPEGRLWTRGDGSPLVGSTVSHWFSDACEAAGVAHFRYHDLRHYYASGLLNRGISIAVVAKYLGHADQTVTSRVYHHVMRHDGLGVGELAGAGLAGSL